MYGLHGLKVTAAENNYAEVKVPTRSPKKGAEACTAVTMPLLSVYLKH